MRLIDADRLKDSIMFTCDLGGWIGETLLQIKKLAVKYIETAPTVDAVEVVRCRDCKFYDRNFEYCHNVVFGDGHANYSPPCVNDDDYCSFGVRREDGEA